jgi:hypothetical protein
MSNDTYPWGAVAHCYAPGYGDIFTNSHSKPVDIKWGHDIILQRCLSIKDILMRFSTMGFSLSNNFLYVRTSYETEIRNTNRFRRVYTA